MVYAFVCWCTRTCEWDLMSVKHAEIILWANNSQLSHPSASVPFQTGRNDFLFSFRCDETRWHGILNSPAQIERNKQQSGLVIAPDKHQDVETTPAQTQQCLQISIFSYMRHVKAQQAASLGTLSEPRLSHWRGLSSTNSRVNQQQRSNLPLNYISTVVLPWPVKICMPSNMACWRPIMNRDTALCGLIIK